ncbi:MAG: RecX family transcriptional regulator [Candidatus Baltobacteraceae bacterium]
MSRSIVAALRLLAARRLTEAQLWSRLQRRGYAEEDVRAAVEACKRDGYLDDRLFARLYVDGRDKAVGDARLVADLVRRGIDREAARRAVEQAERSQDERLDRAMRKAVRLRPQAGYPAVARTLERLGFPAAAIYRRLRAEASEFDEVAHALASAEESFESSA